MPPLLPKSVTPSMFDLTLKRGPTNLIYSNFSRSKFQYFKTRLWQGSTICGFIIHPTSDVWPFCEFVIHPKSDVWPFCRFFIHPKSDVWLFYGFIIHPKLDVWPFCGFIIQAKNVRPFFGFTIHQKFDVWPSCGFIIHPKFGVWPFCGFSIHPKFDVNVCGFQRVGIQNKFDPRRSICQTFCLEIVFNWILASQKAKPVLFQGQNLEDFVSTVNLMEDWRWPNKVLVYIAPLSGTLWRLCFGLCRLLYRITPQGLGRSWNNQPLRLDLMAGYFRNTPACGCWLA